MSSVNRTMLLNPQQHIQAYEASEKTLWEALLSVMGREALLPFVRSATSMKSQAETALVECLVAARTSDVWRVRLRSAVAAAPSCEDVDSAFRAFLRIRESFISQFSWITLRYVCDDSMDAVQDGTLGLMRAIDTATLDLSAPDTFERYAAHWIHRYAQQSHVDFDVFEDSTFLPVCDATLADMRSCLRALSEPEIDVIRLRYGLDGAPAVGLSAIGSILGGISEDRIMEINGEALAKLRRCLV